MMPLYEVFIRKLKFERFMEIFLESVKPFLIVIRIVVIGNKLLSSSWIVVFWVNLLDL